MLTYRETKQLQAHALANYSKGWDFVIESYTGAELAIGFDDLDQAMRILGSMADTYLDQKIEANSR